MYRLSRRRLFDSLLTCLDWGRPDLYQLVKERGRERRERREACGYSVQESKDQEEDQTWKQIRLEQQDGMVDGYM